ncbi:MAG: DMT family transporter [Candidatus Marinimicrobia bacterium]|nr:DMT family transporter [bacterium]MCG2715693.1 DMT family transporter [Candidatus Neomarinimicrobiota bacterium]
MTTRIKHLSGIHIAVLLFGLAGLFGKLIAASPVTIVFGRTAFASVVLWIVIKRYRISLKFQNRRDISGFLLMGTLLAVHWLTFFYSIQVSTVAIGLLTYSSFPVFVTLCEPLFTKCRLKTVDVITALIVMAGMIVIIPVFDIRNNIMQGVLYGLISGWTFALLTIFNKKYTSVYPALKIAFYQDLTACLILLPVIIIQTPRIAINDFAYIAFLGIICTALAHTLFIHSMKHIRAYTAGIIASLEPVYGILLAIFVLEEYPQLRTVIGGLLILGTVFWVTLRSD